MRNLVQPRTLKLAGIAAFVSALACYPRLALWNRPDAPLWYLEAVIFFCAIVLWSFVFAWHTAYSHRPVFVFKIEPHLFILVTVAGLIAAAGLHFFLDPVLRAKIPEDYPANSEQWFALILFTLAFNQLFLIFAPFAWLLRLFRNRWVAAGLTVLFGAVVVGIKIRHSQTPFPPLLVAGLLAGRLMMGILSVAFYLRGGILMSWWWTLLVESRHLLDPAGHPLSA